MRIGFKGDLSQGVFTGYVWLKRPESSFLRIGFKGDLSQGVFTGYASLKRPQSSFFLSRYKGNPQRAGRCPVQALLRLGRRFSLGMAQTSQALFSEARRPECRHRTPEICS